MDTKAKKLADTILEFLRAKGELSLLPDVLSALAATSARVDRRNQAVVTSAYKLDDKELAAVEALVIREAGKKLQVVNVVNPELVAGFTLQIGDKLIDTSYQTKLEDMRR